MKKNLYAALLGAALTVAAAPSAQALTTCQSACAAQHYSRINSLWQTPPPAGTSMADYRQQVLAALNNLNACLAACPAEPAATGTSVNPAPTSGTGGGTTAPSLGGRITR